MSYFQLGKPGLGGAASTGSKLPLDKLDNRLFSIRVNSPSDGSVRLYDANYGGNFPDGTVGLAGWSSRVPIPINAGVLVPTGTGGYQMRIQAHYGSGLNQYDSETKITHVYLDGACKRDFGDLRFGKADGTIFDYDELSVSEGDVADLVVEVALDLNYAQTVYLYCGNSSAVSAADEAATYVENGVVEDVDGAWTLGESEAEIDPLVVVEQGGHSGFWSLNQGGSGSCRVSGSVIQGDGSIAFSLDKLGAYSYSLIYHAFGSAQDWSSRSRIIIELDGNGKTGTLLFYIYAPDANNCYYFSVPITAASSVQKWVIGDTATMGKVGSPNLANVTQVRFQNLVVSNNIFANSELTSATLTIKRLALDVGVTAIDYSGNNNHGTASGTTVTSSNRNSINARRFVNGCLQFAPLTAQNQGALCMWYKPTSFAAVQYLACASSESDNLHFIAFLRIGTDGKVTLRMAEGEAVTNALDYGALTLNTWYLLCIQSTGSAYVLNINALDAQTPTVITGLNDGKWTNDVTGIANFTVGAGKRSVGLEAFATGVIYNVFRTSGNLSNAQIAALFNNHGDPTLKAGKVLVRVAVPSGGTEPTWGVAGSMEMRSAYGVQKLYPSQQDLNFQIDYATKKASIEFYLNNKQRESSNAVVICDDDQTAFWTPHGCTLTDVNGAASGVNRLKIEFLGTTEYNGIYHVYTSTQNWQIGGVDPEFIVLPVWGCNSGQTLRFAASSDPSGEQTSVASLYAYYNFVDNWIGLKYVVIPVKKMTFSDPSINWASIRKVRLRVDAAAEFSVHIDRCTLDVGVWAKIEFSVPDMLQIFNSYVTDAYPTDNWEYWKLSVWNPSTEEYVNTTTFAGDPNNANVHFYSSTARFMDSQTFREVYGDASTWSCEKSAALFTKGRYGQVGTRKNSTAMATQTITYVGKDAKFMVGFVVKLPPNDGQDTAGTGISQCKMKLEVYYV